MITEIQNRYFEAEFSAPVSLFWTERLDLGVPVQLFANAKCTLMPSKYAEPFGFVALESMLSGTPVITTDYGAFPETVWALPFSSVYV